MTPDSFAANEKMIREQIIARGIRDARVLDAMRATPRDLFVPGSLRREAFDDGPLPIGQGQTISQPYIVARMTAILGLQGHERVLEIGTGSGYQTAILARLAREVYSAELEPVLAALVAPRLSQLSIANVILGVGDGLQIFASRAPFDAILSAAAPVDVPGLLIEQLADGGRAVIPAGPPDAQTLMKIERRGSEVITRSLDPVQFVPLRGPSQRGPSGPK